MKDITRKSVPVAAIIMIMLFLLPSCNSDMAYTESHSLSRDGWSLSDTLVFSPVIENTENSYDLYIWVRHSKQYKYSNLWLKVFSELELAGNDNLIEIKLADKTGKWQGTCSQSMCTVRYKLKENFQVEENQTLKIEVVQYMREQYLKEIKDIGIELVISE